MRIGSATIPRALVLAILIGTGLLATNLGSGDRCGQLAPAPAFAADDDILRIHLMWTNDLHGHILPEPARFLNPDFPPPLGGAASAARYIRQVRAAAKRAGEPVLLVDVGDMWQGTPVGSKTKGEPVIEYFNAIGYDLAVPGNHDFDKGRDVAEHLARASNFPWLCANLIEESTGEVVSWCRPTLMIDFDGLRIGVIGIITPATKDMAFPDHVAGLIFLPMAETIVRYRDKLRADGAHLIFLAIHEGLPYDSKQGWQEIVGAAETETAGEAQGSYGANYSYGGMNLMELVNLVPGIDFAVGGHTHRGYQQPWIDPVNHTLCFESYGNGSSLGHAILKIDRQSGTLLGYDAPAARGTLVTLFQDEFWPDEEIAELLDPWQAMVDTEMDMVVGQAAINIGRGDAGSNLVGNLVTDAMREYFEADFSFSNLGGLRANISAGPITARDVFSVLPFGNELMLVEMEGTMIRRLVERKLRGTSNGMVVSGAEVTFDNGRPDWDRVVSLSIGGEDWDPDRLYKAVCTSFLMEGNSGFDFLTTIPADQVMPTGVITADALERYLQLNSPVAPRIDNRWVERPGQPQAAYLQVQYLP